MIRPSTARHIFLASALAVLAALGAATAITLRLERDQAETRRRAALQEAVRGALHRMEWEGMALVGYEASRPVHDYLTFVPRNLGNDGASPSVHVPSTPYVRYRFEMTPDGSLQTQPDGISADAFLRDRDSARRLWDLLRAAEAGRGNTPATAMPVAPGGPDWSNRSKNVAQIFSNQLSTANYTLPAGPQQGMIFPLWQGDHLLLVRIAERDSRLLQGCVLDWPDLKRNLLAQASLPRADLVPAPPASSEAGAAGNRPDGYRLATLPVRLVPGELPGAPDRGLSPARLGLLLAWIGAAIALAASAGVLASVMSLSERRAAFVSAVTHEMRTPLTTFRLYADLLAEGRVEDPAKRQRYYDVLRAEAVRLGHLVENVLAYARLEKRRGPRDLEPLRLDVALDRVLDSLSEQAQRCGRAITVDADKAALSTTLHIDPSAFERILMNLVDNACKHGTPAREPAIRISASREGRWVNVRIADSGPGVPRDVARRLFRAFARSAGDAAGAAPGIGLGLALSRRLARRMRGDLYLDAARADGASFILRLPGHPTAGERGPRRAEEGQ